MATLLGQAFVKTRKEHKCHGCLKIIPIGTKDVLTQTIADERVETLYMCNDCQKYCFDKNCRECIVCEEAYAGYVKECRHNETKNT